MTSMTIPAAVESEIRALLDGEKGDSLDLRRAIIEVIAAAEDRAFAIGWDVAAESTCAGDDDDLADEARFLADLLAQLLPDEPEVLGLAACISLASARRSCYSLRSSGRTKSYRWA